MGVCVFVHEIVRHLTSVNGEACDKGVCNRFVAHLIEQGESLLELGNLLLGKLLALRHLDKFLRGAQRLHEEMQDN
jgi:hypothetical protein